MADGRRVIGVVLAGGQSRRMGRDKALMDWQGRPLIERQIAALRDAGMDEVKVSGTRPDYHAVADPRAGLGPLGGLAGIADAITGDAELVIIPVDMPRLGADLLRTLATRQPEARCLRFAGHILPMRLRLDAASRALLGELLENPEPRQRSLHALQAAMPATEIPLPAGGEAQLTDCNTPERFHEAKP